MVGECVFEFGFENPTHSGCIGDEVVGLDDILDFERRGADHGMCLVGLTVGELSKWDCENCV